MAQRVLSILLGSEVVKICEVALAGKKKVQVYNAIDLVVPEGLCDDGVIINPEGLAQSIIEGLKGEGFSAKKIVFTIASKRIANKEAVIPFCKENRIGEIVNINASEYFPIVNLDSYVINHSILEVIKNESVKNYRLSVIATPIDLIEGYYELARYMRMPIVSIDYAGNSSLQILKLQPSGNEVDAILQMSPESTSINIMEGSTMIMQRSVPYGRNAIVEAVSNSRNVPESVADLILTEEDITDLANSNIEVADAVRSLFSSINRILEFYASRNVEKPIEHIYMIGDVISIRGLVELFNREWDRDVEIINNLHGIEIKNRRNINYEIASNYIANIGAVIAPMKIEYVQEKVKRKSTLPWWLVIISFMASATMVGSILFLYFDAKQECESIQTQIDSFGDIDDYGNAFLLAKRDYDSIKSWYDSTKSANESLSRFIDDLEQVQPSDVSITRISLSDGEVAIDGEAGSKPAVAQFLIELKQLEYVDNVKINYLTEAIKDYAFSESFSIVLQLKYDNEDDTSEVTSEANTESAESTIEEGEEE